MGVAKRIASSLQTQEMIDMLINHCGLELLFRWLSTEKGDGSTTVKLKLVQTQQPLRSSTPAASQPHKQDRQETQAEERPLVQNDTERNGHSTQNHNPSGEGSDQERDSYESDQFESVSELSLSEGEDSVDGEGGRGRLEDLSVTCRKDMSSELDSSITNKYLQQLK